MTMGMTIARCPLSRFSVAVHESKCKSCLFSSSVAARAFYFPSNPPAQQPLYKPKPRLPGGEDITYLDAST